MSCDEVELTQCVQAVSLSRAVKATCLFSISEIIKMKYLKFSP